MIFLMVCEDDSASRRVCGWVWEDGFGRLDACGWGLGGWMSDDGFARMGA